nr:uncharacterized protein CTRU02_00013 [Colletotrichum truncatum]KAF6801264.1 hypothetical protein CTRU02_00013 [Colletotrichum truncatum]
MGSWGTSAERRADRMPKMHVQATGVQREDQADNDVVRNAMMNDLGTIRIDELPLDNTRRERYIAQPSRHRPVITERSEALNGYLALAVNGLNDSEALAVKDLDDLGGPSVYRPPGGPSKKYTESRRPNDTALQGMQTSRNGILLPLGAEVRRFPTLTDADGHSLDAGVAGGEAPIVSPPAKDVPKACKATTANFVAPKKKDATQINGPLIQKVSNPDASLAPHLRNRNFANQHPASILSQDTEGTPRTAASHVATNTLTEPSTVQFGDRLIWRGPCKTVIPGKGQEFRDVYIELKLVSSVDCPQGEAVFILIHQQCPIKRHSLEGYSIVFHKNQQCIVKSVSANIKDAQEIRYNLKFSTIEDSQKFADGAEKLQRVMKYLNDTAITIVNEAEDTYKNRSQESNPPKKSAEVLESPEIMSTAVSSEIQNLPPLQTGAGEESSNIIADIADAFGKLSLDKVKTSPMYQPDRRGPEPLVQYTAEELLKRRASAEAPPGIQYVKIPLLKSHNRVPPHLQQNNQKLKASSLNATQASAQSCQNWLTGNKTPKVKTDETDSFGQKVAAPLIEDPNSHVPVNSISEVDQQISTENTGRDLTTTKEDFKLVTESDVVGESEDTTADSAVLIEEQTKPSANREENEPSIGHQVETLVSNTAQAVQQKATVPQTYEATPPMFENPLLSQAQNVQVFGGQGLPSQESTPQITCQSPIVAQQLVPGIQHFCPTGTVHAISVTYHISYGDNSELGQPQVGQLAVPAVHQTNASHLSNRMVFSPTAQPFQSTTRPLAHPQSSSPAATRIRRGLGSSIFATGHCDVKHAGNFTGGTAFQ